MSNVEKLYSILDTLSNEEFQLFLDAIHEDEEVKDKIEDVEEMTDTTSNDNTVETGIEGEEIEESINNKISESFNKGDELVYIPKNLTADDIELKEIVSDDPYPRCVVMGFTRSAKGYTCVSFVDSKYPDEIFTIKDTDLKYPNTQLKDIDESVNNNNKYINTKQKEDYISDELINFIQEKIDKIDKINKIKENISKERQRQKQIRNSDEKTKQLIMERLATAKKRKKVQERLQKLNSK